MNLSQLPGHAQRRVWLVLLVLVNTPSLFAFNTVLGLSLGRGGNPPLWLMILLMGVISGQAVLMAYWFSLSKDALWFRLAVLVMTLVGGGGVTSLLMAAGEMQAFAQPLDSLDFTQAALLAFGRIVGMALAWFTLAYAVLLPIRRLTGISLGTADDSASEIPKRRQFQMYEWMIWTGIVAIPFLLVRLATLDEREAVLPLSIAVVVLQFSLLLAWPVLQSAFAQRNPLAWSLGTLVAFLVTAFVVCEGAYWIDFDRLSGSPGIVSAMFQLHAWEMYLVSAVGVLSVNGLVLRCVGFRLSRS